MPAFYSVLFGLAFWLIGASVFLGAFLLWAYSEKRSYDEPRRIICPETEQYATVQVDGAAAARSMLAGHQEFPISDCSRWPKRRGCDQACSVQVPLVADDRTRGEYAPFGLTPAQIRIHNPVRMTQAMFAKIAK
jgi:hypothetical protein